LGQFGLLPQDGLRELFEAAEQGLQLSILQSGGLVKGSRFRRELHVDRFAVGLVSEFEVRPVTLARV